MRFLAILPLLCTIAATVLAFLCIFAGSKVNFLENADILTLNTSMLGQSLVNTSQSNAPAWLTSLEGNLQGDVNGMISDIAKSLNIHDFYSAHILDYCEGYYTPTPISNATSQPTKNVTLCSNQTALFTFDPTAILQSELRPGINLTDLHWPSQIQDAITAIQTAAKVTFICYCIGAGFAGLAVIGALIGFFTDGRGISFVNFMLDFLAFLALGIASGTVTAVMVKATDAVNQYGNQIGIAAYKGTTFLGLTWAATGVMLVACFAWILDCCVGRRKQATYVKEGEKGRL